MIVLFSVLALAAAAPSDSAAVDQSGLKPGQRRVKVICQTEVPTGTRFSKRHCMSLEAAKKRQEESEKGWAEIQNRTMYNGAKGN